MTKTQMRMLDNQFWVRFENKWFEIVIWNLFFELWFWFEAILNQLILILIPNQLFGDFDDFKSFWKTKIIWQPRLYFLVALNVGANDSSDSFGHTVTARREAGVGGWQR